MSNQIYPSLVKGLTFTSVKTPQFNTLSQKASNGYSLRIAQMNNPIWHFTLVYDYLYQQYLSPQNTQAYAPFTDLDTMLGFFLSMRGQEDDFLFLDPNDNCAFGLRAGTWRPGWTYAPGAILIDRNGYAQLTAAGGTSGTQYPNFQVTNLGGTTDGTMIWVNQGYFPNGWPNALVPLTLVTDGKGNYYTPLQRSVAGRFLEDITDVVPNSLQVYSNGIPTNNYALAGPSLGDPPLAVPGASYLGLYLRWNNLPAQPLSARFQFYFRVQFEEDTQDFELWAKGLWTIGGGNSKNGNGYLKLETSRSSSL